MKDKIPSLSFLSQDDIHMLMEADSSQSQSGDQSLQQRQRTTSRLSKLPNVEVVMAQRQLEVEMEKQKHLYLTRIDELENRLAQMVKDKHSLEAKLDIAQRRNNGALPHTSVMGIAAKNEVEDVRSGLSHLDVSDIQYIELVAIPEAKRTLLDHIRCKYYEANYALKSELIALKREKSIHQKTHNDVGALQTRINGLQKQLEEKDSIISGLKVESMKLTNEVQSHQQRLRDHHEDITRADEKHQQIKSLEERIEQQTTELKQAQAKLSEVTAYGKSLERDKEELSRKCDMLNMDKNYLEKENIAMSGRVKLMEEKLAQRSSELESVKEEQLGQFQKILQTTEKQRNEYESRLQEELSSIRKRTSMDLDDIRKNTKELYEREIRTLKDTLSSVQEEHRRATNALEHSRQAYNELLSQFNQEKGRLENEAASASHQTKVKSFECERLRVVYEDTLASFKRVQLDNEKYLKKIELLTKEYHDLRMESAAKLNAHEDKKSRKQATEPMYRPKGSSGPSSEVIDDKAHRQALEFELKVANDLLAQTKQPYPLLLEKLKAKELETANLQARFSNLDEQLAAVEQEKSCLLKERNLLLKDIQVVLDNRKQMDSIRSALSHLSKQLRIV